MESDLIEEIKEALEEEGLSCFLEDSDDCEVVDEVLDSFRYYGGDVEVTTIFKYKGRLFSIEVSQDSYGNVEEDLESLKEVFAKEVTKVVYE